MKSEVIMKTQAKVLIATVFAIGFCVTGGIAMLVADSMNEIRIENATIEQEGYETGEANIPIPTSADVCEDSPMSTPNPTLETESQKAPTVTSVAENVVLATIKINTDKKTRTFDIKEGVSEKVLGQGVGHLPSSALPGQEGVCVLMGHRDTEFSILRYTKVGDEFIILMDGEEFVYVVVKIEIVENDTELRFEALKGSALVLVTCYPFRYTGHAPRKFVVYAKRVD